ncbi:MAG TPA: hypothetical protein VFU31_24615 [Candidatus Binatia bacterium]|nr:hypothetical protein [Candidatus Binatia bacterium]
MGLAVRRPSALIYKPLAVLVVLALPIATLLLSLDLVVQFPEMVLVAITTPQESLGGLGLALPARTSLMEVKEALV